MDGSLLPPLSTFFFALAILHVFVSDALQRKARSTQGAARTAYAFFGNTTLIFGIWLIPTLVCMALFEGPDQIEELLEAINYREPFAYFVLVTVATARPTVQLLHLVMARLSRILGRLWLQWSLVLLLCSLLGGVCSPIAIIALFSLYLSSTFFPLRPSSRLAYYTFTTLLIASAASATIFPVNFDFFFQLVDPDLRYSELFRLLGWKALIGVTAIVSLGVGVFWKEFKRMQTLSDREPSCKGEIGGRNLFYLLLLMVASFGSRNAYILLMVIAVAVITHKGFYRKKGKEGKLELYLPLTIAFFTVTLEMFARLQTWWAAPLLASLDQVQTFIWTFLMTGLNEHIPLEVAHITSNVSFLAVAAGGGLTLIAKSSNIVSKKLLKHHFPLGTISPVRHLLYSLPLTLLFACLVLAIGRIW